MQRLLDILIASTALLLLCPLLLPVILALRFTGEGEIFYCQKRVGRGGALFNVYKFATMLKDSPNLGTGTVTLKDDPRVLPLGRLLRKTKLNELPQLLNVLNGTMSLIGPRPQTRRCFDAFSPTTQAMLMRVRPGLSGIGSIVFRNEEDLMHADTQPDRFYDEVIMPYKGRLEEWYVQHRGVQTYFLLIALTGWVVLTHRLKPVWPLLPSLPQPSPRLRRLLLDQ